MVRLILLALLAGGPPLAWRSLYDYDGKAPLDVREAGVEDRDGIKIHDLSFASPIGGRVTSYVLVPAGKGPFPAVLYMHGNGSAVGRAVSRQSLAFAKAGFVYMSIDGPYCGARAEAGGFLFDGSHPRESRDRMIQNVIEMRRSVDLLISRHEVDAGRIGFIGSSYGAITGGLLAGVEKRIKAYVFHSGLGSVLEARIPNARKVMAALPKDQVDKLFECVAPIHYVGGAGPAVLLFQNGRLDDGIPADSGRRWNEAGSEPKRIKWYDAGHGLNAAADRDRLEWMKMQLGVQPLDVGVVEKLKTDDVR